MTEARSLPVLDLFQCEPMHARISRDQCARNHRVSNDRGKGSFGNPIRFGLASCRECPIGKAHAAGERPELRYAALVHAASESPCTCAAPETRTHGGSCISCWALAAHVARMKKLAKPGEFWLFREIRKAESEQELRAKQIPAAAERLRKARAEDVHG